MSTSAERRALAVIAAIAALGVVARVIKSKEARPVPTADEVLALDAQIARVKAVREKGKTAGSRNARTRTAPRTRAVGDSALTRQVTPPKRDVVPRPLVDLDTASASTIEALPWIGPSLAARIVESRDRCGPFGSMEALTRVYGIGEGMSRRLAPHVTFSTPSRPMDATRTEACSGPAKSAAPRRRGRS